MAISKKKEAQEAEIYYVRGSSSSLSKTLGGLSFRST